VGGTEGLDILFQVRSALRRCHLFASGRAPVAAVFGALAALQCPITSDAFRSIVASVSRSRDIAVLARPPSSLQQVASGSGMHS
jgi:hypothetical protein